MIERSATWGRSMRVLLLPIQKALSVILSPHTREYCGLLTGAFRTPDKEENACACCLATDKHCSKVDLSSPDPAVTQPHSSSSMLSTLPSHPPSTGTTTILSHLDPLASPLNPLLLVPPLRYPDHLALLQIPTQLLLSPIFSPHCSLSNLLALVPPLHHPHHLPLLHS